MLAVRHTPVTGEEAIMQGVKGPRVGSRETSVLSAHRSHPWPQATHAVLGALDKVSRKVNKVEHTLKFE